MRCRNGYALSLIHICSAMVHQLDVAEDGTTSTQVIPYGTVLPLPGSKGCSGFVVNLSTGDIRLRDAQVLTKDVYKRQRLSRGKFRCA